MTNSPVENYFKLDREDDAVRMPGRAFEGYTERGPSCSNR